MDLKGRVSQDEFEDTKPISLNDVSLSVVEDKKIGTPEVISRLDEELFNTTAECKPVEEKLYSLDVDYRLGYSSP